MKTDARGHGVVQPGNAKNAGAGQSTSKVTPVFLRLRLFRPRVLYIPWIVRPFHLLSLEFRHAGHTDFCLQCGQPSLVVTIRVHHKARVPKPTTNARRSQEKWRKKRIRAAIRGARKTGAANRMHLKYSPNRSVSRFEKRSAAILPCPE